MGECNKDFEKTMQSFSVFMNALFEANNKKKAEESKVKTIKNITAEEGETCNVDVNMLHDTLAKLPAEIYLKLYHKMQEKVLGYPPLYCGCNVQNTEEEKTEEAKETASSQLSRLTEECYCDMRQTQPEDK